jgi:hypothetical protein
MPFKGGPTPWVWYRYRPISRVLGKTLVKSLGDRQYRIHLSHFYVYFISRVLTT